MQGDECLRNVARIFDNYTRNNDLVARYGGEEFIILVEKQDAHQLLKMGEKLRKAVENLNIENFISKEQTKLTISIGICSVIPRESIEPLKVIHEADHALYQSKRNGKNQTSIIDLN
jgi:diguanylate cyclase (GGDEF)-like protein